MTETDAPNIRGVTREHHSITALLLHAALPVLVLLHYATQMVVEGVVRGCKEEVKGRGREMGDGFADLCRTDLVMVHVRQIS